MQMKIQFLQGGGGGNRTVPYYIAGERGIRLKKKRVKSDFRVNPD